MSRENLANLSQRIQWIIDRDGLSQTVMADRLGISGSYVSQLLSGERTEISKQLTKLISYAFNVSEEWVVSGEGELVRNSHSEKSHFTHDQIIERHADYNEYVFVPQVSGEISAGGGLVADDTVEMKIAFRKEWIERRGDPKNMSLIRVSGDSMEPTLQSGDLALVDHGRNYFDPQGGIYAISIDHSIMIKRLQVLYPSKRIKVISDNGRYESSEMEMEQVKINGKVIWFGREIER